MSRFHGVRVCLWFFTLVCLFDLSLAAQSGSSLGIFDQHSDVGTVLHAGAVEYDAGKQTYTIAGSGENMWSVADAFQFVWKKASGDLVLSCMPAASPLFSFEMRKALSRVRSSRMFLVRNVCCSPDAAIMCTWNWRGITI